MKHTRPIGTTARTAAVLGALTLIATACGSETSSDVSSGPEATPAAMTARAEPTRETTGDGPESDEPEVDAAGPNNGSADSTADAAAPDDTPTPLPVSCGEFGPVLEHELMPTLQFDTDGDGDVDDDVTAYYESTWRIRVIEDDVVSEAEMPEISDWAHLDGAATSEHGDTVRVKDVDTGTLYTFSTATGCVELIDTHVPATDLDDLTSDPTDPSPDPDPTPSELGTDASDDLDPTDPSPDPTDTGPVEYAGGLATIDLGVVPGLIDDPVVSTIDPELLDDLVAAVPTCGWHGAIPSNATIVSDVMLDIAGDGTADDRVVSYHDGAWKLRAIVDGTISEVTVDDVDPHAVEVLGAANVGAISSGNEIVATVGGGASASFVGFFGRDERGCLFQFVDVPDDDFGILVGGGAVWGNGMYCAEGLVAATGYEVVDDFWVAWGSAYHEASAGVFSYLPASDDYSEGEVADGVPTVSFDCFGMAL